MPRPVFHASSFFHPCLKRTRFNRAIRGNNSPSLEARQLLSVPTLRVIPLNQADPLHPRLQRYPRYISCFSEPTAITSANHLLGVRTSIRIEFRHANGA